jgi:hypothetical protein
VRVIIKIDETAVRVGVATVKDEVAEFVGGVEPDPLRGLRRVQAYERCAVVPIRERVDF